MIKEAFYVSLCYALSSCATPIVDNGPLDASASRETIELYSDLKEYGKQGRMLFGQEDATVYGHMWSAEVGRSDIKDVCGSFPALYGWDLGGIEHGDADNIDGVPFEVIRSEIINAHNRGGVNTISWHMDNPLGGDSWKVDSLAVASVIPGGQHHDLYKEWLARAAKFLLSLQDSEGEMVPVIFRPLHEQNGNWFWWGAPNCNYEDYKTLWKFTVDYLKDSLSVHNLLYAYSPNYASDRQEYMQLYPGDNYVDIFTTDGYQFGTREEFIKQSRQALSIIKEVGDEKSKPYALSEVGYESIPDSLWWTGSLLPVVKDSGISYVMVWRNAADRPQHFYGPYPGHPSAQDFCRFVSSGTIIMNN